MANGRRKLTPPASPSLPVAALLAHSCTPPLPVGLVAEAGHGGGGCLAFHCFARSLVHTVLSAPSSLQDWLQMQAKAEEDAVRREVNENTVRTNKQLAEERRLAELQEKVGTFCLLASLGLCK